MGENVLNAFHSVRTDAKAILVGRNKVYCTPETLAHQRAFYCEIS